MAELDVAMLIIFFFGVFGLITEPSSPHPLAMVCGFLIYYCAKITVPIVGTCIKHRKEEAT